MGEISKVRLVNCPKCETLLPENFDYSVYQCHGCGAVLQAKKKADFEVVFEKSEKDGRVCEIDGSVSDTAVEKFVNGPKNDVLNREFDVEIVDFGELRSEVDSLIARVDNAYGLRKTSRDFDRNMGDVRQEERVRTRQVYFHDMRSSSSSSNYVGEVVREARSVEHVEPDREELLRTLEELKDQLRRVQNPSNKFQEKRPEYRISSRETYVESEDYCRGHPSTYRQVSREFIAPPQTHVVAGGLPYHDRYHRHDMTSRGYHNTIHNPSYVPRYEDPSEPQMFQRPSHPQYMMGHEIDQFEGHPHHYSCSCYRCYAQQQVVVPEQLPSPSAFSNRTFHHVPAKSDPYHHERRGSLGSPRYNTRTIDTISLGSEKPRSHSRWPSDHVPTKSDPYHHERRGSLGSPRYNARTIDTISLGSEKPPSHSRWPSDPSLERNMSARPQRAVVLSKGHRYHPIASGAPFVTCRNCFELLRLPKKVCIDDMGEWRMTCAACSSEISFAFVDDKLASVDPSAKERNHEIDDSVNEVTEGYLKRNNVSYCSEDYANAGFDFHAMDRDPSFSSTSRSLSSKKSEDVHNVQSVSYTSSEDERLLDDFAGSPPQEPFDYTSKYPAVDEAESRSDEKVMTIKSTLGKLSLKESLATEMELSPSSYGSARLSKHASEKRREDDELKTKKGDSFFGGFLKKSFRSNQSIETVKKNVMVNGHLIPDKLVKKAEKLAGPIHSGDYWYDYRAGFWGVTGGPCLGIIPSSIEEFNYPMPEKCAAGTTGVFVNGRELHQRDLELLSTRGLPSSTDKSYIVDISGKVVDEDTGEEHVSLGKLAPTIEKVKHGFGMRPPKAVA